MAKRQIHGKTGSFMPNRITLFRKSSDIIITEIEMKERKKNNIQVNSDSELRQKIHNSIKQMLSEEKGKVEILAYLSNTYPNTYLSKFFAQWIEYHIEKKDYSNDQSRKIKDDEVR